MFRYQTSKRALFIAAMIILLCLAGSTLAIFTSDKNDGTIGVVAIAGDIEVDIVDADDTSRSLIDGVLQFESSTDGERFDIDSVYFEPGRAFRTQGFKVKNTGNIDIKFRMYISADDKIDMNVFNEAFEILISTDPDDFSKAENIIYFEDELARDTCAPDTYYLYIKMRETAGNEFQGDVYSGIGVTVYAVQGNINIKE